MIKIKTSRKAFYNFQHTALTDIIFLLMIFFLLTSSFVIGAPDSLQSSGKSQMSTGVKIIHVRLENKNIYLENQKISAARLTPALQKLKSASEELQVNFEAAAATPLGDFRNYIDLARNAGVDKFSFAISR
jgi:biopolymer transport protein ExbD